MTKLATILKKLMEEDGLHTTELARLSGVLQPVLHRMVSGHTDNPRIHTLLPLAKQLGVTVDQLMGESPLPLQRVKPDPLAEPQSKKIPLLSHWQTIRAHLVPQKETSDHKSDQVEFIQTAVPVGDKAYALRVKDSTMLPRFVEGSLLIVDPDLKPINGDFVIVSLTSQSEPMFKQIFFDGDDIYLKPLNTDFKNILLDKNAAHQFLGVVVENQTRLKLI